MDFIKTGFERLTGTPAYLAPEVLNGSEPSVASDTYSLGVALSSRDERLPGRGGSVDEIGATQPERLTADHPRRPPGRLRERRRRRVTHGFNTNLFLRQVRTSPSIDGSMLDPLPSPQAGNRQSGARTDAHCPARLSPRLDGRAR